MSNKNHQPVMQGASDEWIEIDGEIIWGPLE